MRTTKHHKILAALFLLFACHVARADTIELTEFRATLRNALFIVNQTQTSNWLEGSMKGSGRGLKFEDFFSSDFTPGGEPCINGCLPGEQIKFDFAGRSLGDGNILQIGSERCSPDLDEPTCYNRHSLRFRGGSALTLPAATLPPATELFPINGPMLSVVVPFSLEGRAEIFDLRVEPRELAASATYRATGTAKLSFFTLEPTFDNDFTPCAVYGERCWVLDRIELISKPVPEPSSLLLLGTGLAGAVAGVGRKIKGTRRTRQDDSTRGR